MPTTPYSTTNDTYTATQTFISMCKSNCIYDKSPIRRQARDSRALIPTYFGWPVWCVSAVLASSIYRLCAFTFSFLFVILPVITHITRIPEFNKM